MKVLTNRVERKRLLMLIGHLFGFPKSLRLIPLGLGMPSRPVNPIRSFVNLTAGLWLSMKVYLVLSYLYSFVRHK